MVCKSEGVEEDDEESSLPMSREKTESKLKVSGSASRENTKMINLHKTLLKYSYQIP